MPELPEVEFARRLLERRLVGGRIVDVVVSDARVLEDGTAGFARAVRGASFVEAARRGKWLRLTLDVAKPRRFVFSHLGMTGKWVHVAHDAEPPRFERLRLVVEGPRSLRRALVYADMRIFGGLRLTADAEAAFRQLGPDPLVDGLDAPTLARALEGTRRSIKEALLDQARLAGIGNIHAQEALFRARIDPRRAASTLDKRELSRLARGILGTIDDALRAVPGETITYVEERGAENPFAIYGRGGAPCPRCRSPLARIVQGGRSTVFCGRCQG